MSVKLVRNLMTGLHRGQTRIWIEPTALEAAGLQAGDHITQIVQGNAIVIRRSVVETDRSVSKRKRPGSSYERPLFESCSKEVSLVLLPRQRIDILVSDGMLVIQKERSFDLFLVETPQLQGSDLKKLRLYSGPCGAGLATAVAVDTGLYEPVGAVDLWPEAVDAYLHNFKDGCAYLGDLTRKHTDYIPQADVCWLSPSCVNFSSLGNMNQGITEGHGPHYARIVLATGAQAVMIEQVPAYFKSESYAQLKQLLRPFFPSIYETVIDAYDAGSVAGRVRGYAVFFRERIVFAWPRFPKLPEHRRKTVGQVIGKEWEEGEWRSIEGTVMQGLLSKSGPNNFSSEKNNTLVDLEQKRISAFVANYRKFQVTSSYLRHPSKPIWRPFRSDEIAAMLNIPAFYEFPDWMSEGLIVKLLGQSIDGNVVKPIQISVAVALMGQRYRQIAGQRRNEEVHECEVPIVEEEGQGSFWFE